MVKYLVLLFMLLCSIAYAAPTVRIVDEKDTSIESRQMKTATVAGTVYGAYTQVSTAVIVPGKTRILGYSIVGNGGDSFESLTALYDDNSTAVGRNLLINESEVTSTDQKPIWFPSPIKVSYGLVVRTGIGVNVIIYYFE